MSDTAAHISAWLECVNTNSHVTKIVVSDSGSNAVSVSVAQLTIDATAMGELFQADGTTLAHVTVSDSAAHVTAALDSLNGNTQVTKIVAADSAGHRGSATNARAGPTTSCCWRYPSAQRIDAGQRVAVIGAAASAPRRS